MTYCATSNIYYGGASNVRIEKSIFAIISIPIYPKLSLKNVDYISKEMIKFLKNEK